MQTEVIIVIVIVLVIIYMCYRKKETFLSPVGWAPVGADLFEVVGRGPMYGYGSGTIHNTGITADTIELRDRVPMYGF